MDEIPAEMPRPPGNIRAPEKEKEIRSYAVKYSRYQLDVDDQIIDVDAASTHHGRVKVKQE